MLSLRAMRNEDIAELMKAMEASFKQHSDDQLAKFSSLLEQHIAITDQRFSQVVQQRNPASMVEVTTGQASSSTENNQYRGYRAEGEAQPSDLNSLLRTLRLDVPRFDGTNVENWIYKAEKFSPSTELNQM